MWTDLEYFFDYLKGSPELLVVLEFVTLLCGSLAAIAAKRHNLVTCSFLYCISATSLLLSWRSLNAVISVVMLLCVCLLMHFESNTYYYKDYKQNYRYNSITAYSKGAIWFLLFISIIATLILRIVVIKQFLFIDKN